MKTQIGPFSIVPEWVLFRDLSSTALKLYIVLGRFADWDTGRAFPSRATLADRMKCSEKTVDRAVIELVEAGCIEKQSRGRYESAVYTVLQVDPNGQKCPDERTKMSKREDKNVHLTITNEQEPINNIKRATKLNRYKPSPDLQEDLKDKYPELDYDDTLEAFIDHHTAKGSTFKDWDAAARTWWRNAKKWSEPKTVIHKQEVKGTAEGPGRREWVRKLHAEGEHFECKPGEFGCK
jgi:DNA-binding transcriptional regulator YhcF (GntR family)